MLNKLLLIFCFFNFCLYSNVQGQIDLSNLDRSRWDMDTMYQSLIIKPRFIFDSDTTITFYDSKMDSKSTVLILKINQGRHSLFGKFTGSKEYPNNNKYLITNYGVEKIDSLKFMNMIDTIEYEKNESYYFINLKLLGISERDSYDFTTSSTSPYLYLIGSDNDFEQSTYNKSHEIVVWEDKDPPYLTKSVFVIRDAIKK